MSVSTSIREEIPAVTPPTTGRRISPRRCTRNKNKTVMQNLEMEIEPPSSRKRRSSRGSSSLWELARFIKDGKQVVFITGAGLSVASGVRAFRTTNSSNSKNYSSDSAWKNNPASTRGGKKGKSEAGSKKNLVEEQPMAIWSSTLWTNAKRETFRKDPIAWWNDFFLRHFPVEDYDNRYNPNAGHVTLAALQRSFPDTIKIITQNVDGLQEKALLAEERNEETATKLRNNIIEAHGRLGLYKCLPEDDSDTDSSDDEDDDRPVHLGHRRKHRAWKRRHESFAIARKKTPKQEVMMECAVSTDVSSASSASDTTAPTCEYQMLKSLRVDQLGPPDVRAVLKPRRANPRAAAECDSNDSKGPRKLKTPPRCPSCGNKVLPQALLFDEGYHSHDHYSFIKMEDWLAAAEVLVFVGTSFSVTLPQVALDHAREVGLPVFNFNVSDMLGATARLNVENITGPSQETLPKLYQAIQHLEQGDALLS